MGYDHNESLKAEYDRHQSGPKGRPSDEASHGGGLLSPAEKTSTIIKEDDDVLSERAPHILIESADILLLVKEHGNDILHRSWSICQLYIYSSA